MKLDDMRRRFHPGALPEAIRAPEPGERVLRPGERRLTAEQINSGIIATERPKWTWARFALPTFVTAHQSSTFQNEIKAALAQAGWGDAGVAAGLMTFQSDDDIFRRARLYTAFIPHAVEGAPNHRQFCRLHVEMDKQMYRVAALGIPEPCEGRLKRPKSKLATSVGPAVLYEAMRSWGWPPETEAIIIDRHEGRTTVCLWHDESNTAFDAHYNTFTRQMEVPVYPNVAMPIDHSILEDMSR